MISILGENIKNIREERKLTIKQLSQLANVGVATISEIETGKRQGLTSASLERISKALQISTNDLLSITETSVEVTDLVEIIDIILKDDELSIDNVVMSNVEKEKFKFAVNMAIYTILENRKKQVTSKNEKSGTIL